MKVLHLATKGKYVNTLELFHVYNISKKGFKSIKHVENSPTPYMTF
jgi:hypothetical protein